MTVTQQQSRVGLQFGLRLDWGTRAVDGDQLRPAGGEEFEALLRFRWGVYLYRLYSSSTKLKAIDAWNFETALIETDNGLPTMQFGYQTDQPVVHLIR